MNNECFINTCTFISIIYHIRVTTDKIVKQPAIEAEVIVLLFERKITRSITRQKQLINDVRSKNNQNSISLQQCSQRIIYLFET